MLYAFFDDSQFSLSDFPQLSSFNACEELDHLIILYPPVPRTHEYWGTLSPPITMVAPPLKTLHNQSINQSINQFILDQADPHTQ